MRFKTISLKKPKASQFLSRGNPAGLLWGGKGAPLIWTTSDPRAWAVRPTPVTITATRDRSAEQFPCHWGRHSGANGVAHYALLHAGPTLHAWCISCFSLAPGPAATETGQPRPKWAGARKQRNIGRLPQNNDAHRVS